MDGYGNPRGFTTVFDGNPVKEYLTGYENVAPEQIGLPAAANLKDPEIQQFKDLNTFNQQAFDNFMQLDGTVKDYAIKLKAAGVNINSPRNRDEIAAVMQFNNLLKERNKLGFILSQERGVADEAVQVAGRQDAVLDPNFNQYTPQGLNAATRFIPADTRMTQMFPTEKFANQEQADAYNQQRQMIAQQLMEAYQLTPEQAAASPEFAQALEQGMRRKTGLLGVGVVDQNLADEQNLKRFEAQTRRIAANRPTGGGGNTPQFANVIQEFQTLSNSSDPTDFISAAMYVQDLGGFNQYKKTPSIAESAMGIKEQTIPLQLMTAVINDATNMPTHVVYSNNQKLIDGVASGKYTVKDGQIIDTASGMPPSDLPANAYYNVVSKGQIESFTYRAGEAEKKLGYTPAKAKQTLGKGQVTAPASKVQPRNNLNNPSSNPPSPPPTNENPR